MYVLPTRKVAPVLGMPRPQSGQVPRATVPSAHKTTLLCACQLCTPTPSSLLPPHLTCCRGCFTFSTDSTPLCCPQPALGRTRSPPPHLPGKQLIQLEGMGPQAPLSLLQSHKHAGQREGTRDGL